MASSNIDQPWMSTTIGAGDSWYPITDAFARETESALTKALQQSLFNSDNISLLNHPVSTNFTVEQQQNNDYYYYTNKNNNTNTNTASASTITVSGSGSEPETPRSRPKGNNNLGVLNAKATKRKSRASKRSMTTFIQADPANFRQMVQQVTGVKFEGNGNSNSDGQFPSVIKPETVCQPYINKLQGLLPTLDTSAYLLDHHNKYRGSAGLAEDGGVGNDFYAFSCFPTLESSI